MSRFANMLPAFLGGVMAMASLYFHSPQLVKLILVGAVGGLGVGLLLPVQPAGSPDSLAEAIRGGLARGSIAGLWGGLMAWLLLCIWNGPGVWVGLTPLP